MGQPELCIPHDEISVERLWSLWCEAFARRTELASQLVVRKAELLEDTNRAVEDTAGLINGKAGEVQR